MDKLIVKPGLKNLVPFKNNKPNIKPRDNVSSDDSNKVTEGKWGEAKWRIKGNTLEIYGDNDDQNHVYIAESITTDSPAPWLSALPDQVAFICLRIYIYISFKENSELIEPFVDNINGQMPLILNHTITKLDLTNVETSIALFHGLLDLGVVKFTTNTSNVKVMINSFDYTVIGYLNMSSFNLSGIVESYVFNDDDNNGLENFFGAKDGLPYIYTITTPHQFDNYGYFIDEFLKAFTGYYNVLTKEQVKDANDVKPSTTYITSLDNYDWYLNGSILIINLATVELFAVGPTEYITCMPWVIHKLEITKVIIKGLIEFPVDLLSPGEELIITLFSDMPNLVEIEGLEHIKLNNITDISNLFNNCPKLESVKCNGINVMNYIGLTK